LNYKMSLVLPRQTDRHVQTETDRDRQIDRQKERHADRQTDRQTKYLYSSKIRLLAAGLFS